MQNIWLSHLNDLYNSEEKTGKRGIVVANGGVCARTLFYAYYTDFPYDNGVDKFNFHLLPERVREISSQLQENPLEVQLSKPDLTFYLFVPLSVLEERIKNQYGREGEIEDRIASVRENFDRFHVIMQVFNQKYPDRFIFLDGTKPKEEISDEIMQILKERKLI